MPGRAFTFLLCRMPENPRSPYAARAPHSFPVGRRDGDGMRFSERPPDGRRKEKPLCRDQAVTGAQNAENENQQMRRVPPVNFGAILSCPPSSCLQKVNGATESRYSHDLKLRERISGNLAGMNVACGGTAAVIGTPTRRATPAVVSPRLIAIDLTHRHDVSAAKAVACRRSFMKDPDFVACCSESMAVVGRGDHGHRQLHTHLVATLRSGGDLATVGKLMRKLARRHGFGPILKVEPVRSVEDFGDYLGNNAVDVRAKVPKGTAVIAISANARRMSATFSWFGKRDCFARRQRKWIGCFARCVGVEDMDGFQAALGSMWHGRLTQQFLLVGEGKKTDEVIAWYERAKAEQRTATPRSPKTKRKRTRKPKKVRALRVAPTSPCPSKSASSRSRRTPPVIVTRCVCVPDAALVTAGGLGHVVGVNVRIALRPLPALSGVAPTSAFVAVRSRCSSWRRSPHSGARTGKPSRKWRLRGRRRLPTVRSGGHRVQRRGLELRI